MGFGADRRRSQVTTIARRASTITARPCRVPVRVGWEHGAPSQRNRRGGRWMGRPHRVHDGESNLDEPNSNLELAELIRPPSESNCTIGQSDRPPCEASLSSGEAVRMLEEAIDNERKSIVQGCDSNRSRC